MNESVHTVLMSAIHTRYSSDFMEYFFWSAQLLSQSTTQVLHNQPAVTDWDLIDRYVSLWRAECSWVHAGT